MKKQNLIMPFGIEGLLDIIEDFDDVQKIFQNKNNYTNYPPSNIFSFEEDSPDNPGGYLIKLAVAGWSEDELEVSMENGDKLFISGKQKKEIIPPTTKIIHHGIAERGFEKEFLFNTSIKNVDVHLKDGFLSVTVSLKKKNEDKKIINIKNK